MRIDGNRWKEMWKECECMERDLEEMNEWEWKICGRGDEEE